jgi:hypothetical protein
MLFHPPYEELPDEEVAAILRQVLQGAGRLPRTADVYLAGTCAEHLVDGLRAAGVLVVRPVQDGKRPQHPLAFRQNRAHSDHGPAEPAGRK